MKECLTNLQDNAQYIFALLHNHWALLFIVWGVIGYFYQVIQLSLMDIDAAYAIMDKNKISHKFLYLLEIFDLLIGAITGLTFPIMDSVIYLIIKFKNKNEKKY